MVLRFQRAWETLHMSNDDFIRTTQPRHVCVVEAVLQDLWDKSDIYLGRYEGWYCVPDGRFRTERDTRGLRAATLPAATLAPVLRSGAGAGVCHLLSANMIQ
jgi:methionyl-tRNA synthetase